MNPIQRKTAPDFSNPKAPEILLPEQLSIKNIPLFIYRKQEWDVSRLVWCIPGGSANQKKKLAAAFTARMLTEGTIRKTSAEIADFIDFYGAFLDVRSDEHYTFVTLYCMNKHLSGLIPLLFEIMHESTFPESELDIEIQNTIQEYLINNEKVAAVSRRIFPSLIFGKEHPYGRYADISDFETINRTDLINHYQSAFHFSESFFILSGHVENEDLKSLEKELSSFPFRIGDTEAKFEIQGTKTMKHHIEKEVALQTAIRIGKEVIPQSHADFPAFVLGNTILGGYFGSRLMSNIREKKGLTYGIGSAIISRKLASYAAIITEVKAENTSLAIDEIFFELNRLISEKIDLSELELVKNYIIGSGLKGFDGPIQLAERFTNLYCMNINFAEYYTHFFEQIIETSEEKVREVLHQYLNPEDMVILTVGKA